MKGSFDHASESFKKRNPHLFHGHLDTRETTVAKRNPVLPLDAQQSGDSQATQALAISVVFALHTKRLRDDDSLVWSLKGTRDAIAQTIGIDDADPRITWHYHQIIDRHEGVCVKITAVLK